MERSQSRLSLSASFEALAIYFPCMNSFDEEDADGDGRRLKGAIQRSTETGLAVEMPSRTVRQASHESIEDSMNSYGSEGNLNFSGVHLASAGQFSDFLGSMGPAQFVGRQTLATTSMEHGLALESVVTFVLSHIGPLGHAQTSSMPKPMTLTTSVVPPAGLHRVVSVIQLSLLVCQLSFIRPSSVPASLSRQSVLLPLHATPCVSLVSPVPLASARLLPFLQVIVWGNYGRMERKHFMGVARVLLEELDLSTLAIGWYKLFPTSSMVDPTTGPLLRQSSQLSLESTVGPCCDRS
ncbi:regulating synaptic membrane exocytosis protein 4 isoform X1 [Rissa tridactyla]|uniref:regulating synaptic membrane exocytosis protein 4 isoform X1 n=1 Tax=Rissa tridactyla TaxID=75485 RepID=UPI0023BA5045|nr:regulating synaptic membrane exocytosis protein 4 isoform X1 [Rissa tridactyla]